MKTNRCMDTSVFPEATEAGSMNMNMEMSMSNMPMGCCMPQTVMCPPVMECPQVNCCHRVINYEVPQE